MGPLAAAEKHCGIVKEPRGIREQLEALGGTAGEEGVRMIRSLAERDDIVTAVRTGTTVVAWVTEKGVVIYFPGDTELKVLVGADRSIVDAVDEKAMRAGVDVPVVIVEGITGLAATDPDWDGRGDVPLPEP